MKIWLVEDFFQEFNRTSPQQVLALALLEHGHEVCFFTTKEDGWLSHHGVIVIKVAGEKRVYSADHPDLNEFLSLADALGVASKKILAEDGPADIIDCPLNILYGLKGLNFRASLLIARLTNSHYQKSITGHQESGYTAKVLLVLETILLRKASGLLSTGEIGNLSVNGFAGNIFYLDEDSLEESCGKLITWYQFIHDHRASTPIPNGQTVYQVMEALDVGDAVSAITRTHAQFLEDGGNAPAILVRHAHPDVKYLTRPTSSILANPEINLIFHFWGYNTSMWLLSVIYGRKALYFHNITPPQYFNEASRLYTNTTMGWGQLAHFANEFDLIIGDSKYDIAELSAFIKEPKPSLHIYPVVDSAVIQAASFDKTLAQTIRSTGTTNMLFVGRVARNKRQDRLIRLFNYYFQYIDHNASLWIVGNKSDPDYCRELNDLIDSLPCRERIVMTGKVADEQLYAYYRSADVFVCASEHEGFCMPLVEAMALNIPVLAFNSSVIPETLGDSGVLINNWDEQKIAEIIRLILTNQSFRSSLVEKQRINLRRFSAEEARQRIKAVVDFLSNGQESDYFVQLNPSSAAAPKETSVVSESRHASEASRLISLTSSPNSIINYMIAFTPRNGSTLLCDYLALNGIGRPTEYFQYPFGRANEWVYKALSIDQDDFVGYLDAIKNKCSPNHIFGAKIAWNHKNVLLYQIQLNYVSINDLGDFFPKIKWVFLKRKDKLMQAVSLWRAAKTSRWHSLDPNIKDPFPQYDYFKILSFLQTILTEENLWEKYFVDRKISPFVLYYEDLVNQPRQTLLPLIRYLQGEKKIVQNEEDISLSSILEKLSDEYSENIKALFIADLYHIGVDEYWDSRSSELTRWDNFMNNELWKQS